MINIFRNTDVGEDFKIRFPHRTFSAMRERLLDDLSREHWAVILARSIECSGCVILAVHQILFPSADDYEHQSRAFVRLKKSFVHRVLTELRARGELDTIIDVHTHPFSVGGVAFSGVDDADEVRFAKFLKSRFDGLRYGSMVLSQTQYSARVWIKRSARFQSATATVQTQTLPEAISSSDRALSHPHSEVGVSPLLDPHSMFHRTALALGVDVLRALVEEQKIVIGGLGGLGSVIAENLIHLGFRNLVLIDPDVLDISNISRVVGAYYGDAEKGLAKVQVIARHLTSINPEVRVVPLRNRLQDEEARCSVAGCNWLIVATDNHSSRMAAQRLSLEFYVPLISAGVNISVENGRIEDMSGEIITSRVGDDHCLFCLGRINYAKVASESHPDEVVRAELRRRGYVEGLDVYEPAVKTLNSIVGSLAVDVLLNQYLERARHSPILVYENNEFACIYEDRKSLERRGGRCFTCSVYG